MDYEAKFTVTLQGQAFTLTKSQIEFDAPNYFTSCFLGNFREAEAKSVELNRDPGLFKIVSTYLCGYGVLPLQESTIALLHMSPNLALINLRADAVFYQLDGLVEACDKLIKLQGIQDPKKSRLLIVGAAFGTADDDEEIPVDPPSDASVFQIYISESKLQEEPLKDMIRPELAQGFEDIRMSAAMEKFAARSVRDYDPRRYRLDVGQWEVQVGLGTVLFCSRDRILPVATRNHIEQVSRRPLVMEYEPKFTISLCGKEFVLSKSQIEFDSPNYFTAGFLGDFAEAQTRRIELFRDPGLFSIIITYLCGYTVLPLRPESIPPTMSLDNALLNLRADTAFYQLDGLIKGCDDLIALNNPESLPQRRYMILGGKSSIPLHLFEDDPALRDDPVGTLPSKPDWKTYVSVERLEQPPLNELITPGSLTEFDGLETVAKIERFASQLIQNYDERRWKLLGWTEKVKHDDTHGVDVAETEWLVVMKDLEYDRRSA